MRNEVLVVAFGCVALAGLPAGGRAQVAWQTDCVTKEVELSEKGRDPANFRAAEVELGTRVKARCRFYVETVDGKKAVNAGAILDNGHSRPMHYSYSVAFFDGEGKLVAAFSRRSAAAGIPANGSETLEGCRAFGPGSELGKIRSVQVRLYESELAIGEP